jgi:RNA polymerase sigma-70 factor (ECF subfamily)
MNDDSPVQHRPPGIAPPPDFATFMRNYQNMVFTTAVRLTGDAAQAEDISQEVFVKAYDHFEMLATTPTAGGWLKTVTRNMSLNHLQRYRKRWSFFSEFRAGGDGGDSPEVEFAAPDTFFAEMDAGERGERVEEALAKLPDRYRVPLVLYHFDELSYDEIAAKLKISLAKVKTDILRARAALAKELAGADEAKISSSVR